MATLTFQPYGKRTKVKVNQTFLEAARANGVYIRSICGAKGLCGKCRIIVHKGKEYLSQPSEAERRIFSEEDLENGFRLACQVTATREGEIVVEVPRESQVDRQRLLLRGLENNAMLAPAVRKITISLEEPSLLDTTSDVDRIVEAVERKTGFRVRIDYETLKRVPHVLRKGKWEVIAVIWRNQEIISVQPGENNEIYGLAVDVGTTKLAGFLLDLNDGKVVAAASMMNPQIAYGEDIISRIRYVMENDANLSRLQQVVVEGVNRLISELCKKAGISPNEIFDAILAGNTAMHHIFLGIPPNYLSQIPYPAALQSPIDVKARDLALNIERGAYLHALPAIAGFVGGDAVADILATGVHEADELSMLVDVGTNTEIVLGNKDRLIACSCASGPAFEGAHIKHGMRAATGAIERIWIDPQNYEVGYKTIGDVKPRGICGSAIVDVVAEMLKVGLVDHSGKFNREAETPRLRLEKKPAEFVIAWNDETSIDSEIVVTQEDIREVQLAKAAIYTGAYMLMRQMKVQLDDIQRIFLAGAFGTYVDPNSARIIGMYPDVPLNKVRFVGNTAGSGARMALLSVAARKKAEDIAKRVKYVELGAEPDFQNEFVKATYFPHQQIARFPSVSKMLGRSL